VEKKVREGRKWTSVLRFRRIPLSEKRHKKEKNNIHVSEGEYGPLL
jgi:hypothetical protein